MSCFSDALARPDGQTLEEHLLDVTNDALENAPFLSERERGLLAIVCLSHDIGKLRYEFQESVKGIKEHRKQARQHAVPSSIFTFRYVYSWLDSMETDEDEALLYSAWSAAMVARHHRGMNALNTTLESMITEWSEQAEAVSNLPLTEIDEWMLAMLNGRDINITVDLPEISEMENLLIDSTLLDLDEFSTADYLHFRMMFSLLLAADIRSAARYRMSQKRAAFDADMVGEYKRIKFGNKDDELSVMRQRTAELILSRTANVKGLTTLTAPTGSGKTLIGLEAALRISEGRRIVYCLPFTSIIDQNTEVFRDVLGEDPNAVLKHHHLAELPFAGDNQEYEDFQKAEILMEHWDSSVVVTTFVQLFNTLFGVSKSSLIRLSRLAGTVILLDEVQAVPRKDWEIFEEILSLLIEKYDVSVILMTATQPAIALPQNSFELVPPEAKQLWNGTDRYRLINRTQQEITAHELAKEIAEKDRSQNIIAILNTKKESIELFNLLKDEYELENVKYLSSNITPLDRARRIEELKKNTTRSFILVTTQVIEAGVDISCGLMYRDLAPLDAIVQSAGRCNRNKELKMGEIRVVKIKRTDSNRLPAYMVYGGILLDQTLRILSDTQYSEEQLRSLTVNYFNNLKRIAAAGDFDDAVSRLDFKRIEEEAQLIKDYPKTSYFVVNDQTSENLWQEYQNLSELENFLERRMVWKQMKPRFMERVISVRDKHHEDQLLPLYDDGYNIETGWIENKGDAFA